MRQIASPLALLDSGPPRPYSLFVSHRARSLLDTATKLNTRLQPDPWAHPLQMVTLIWKIIPLHRCTVAEIGSCSIFNRLCSCGQSVEIATLPWKIGNAHPNQPANALYCELNQIAQIFHGQGVFQCRCKCCATRVLEFQSNQISSQKQITFVPWNSQL